jgi:flagellar protein FliO/FliZ
MIWLMIYAVVLAVLAGGGWLAWRQFGNGGSSLFGGNREARIGVTETASVDGKRRLVLIHRDGVEHLIMTGGPIDVVIEQGILQQRRAAAMPAATAAVVASHEPRYAAQQAHAAHEAAPVEPPGNFGRLRQRPQQSQPVNEPAHRSDGPGFAAGGGNR